MFRTFNRSFTCACVSGLLVSSFALAAPMSGAVTSVEKGMATVRTLDGKDHQIKASDDWKVGSRVDCEARDGKMECRPAVLTTAGQPQGRPTTQPVAQKPAQPAVQTPAQSQGQQPTQPKTN
jgi:hypothetical protein